MIQGKVYTFGYLIIVLYNQQVIGLQKLSTNFFYNSINSDKFNFLKLFISVFGWPSGILALIYL